MYLVPYFFTMQKRLYRILSFLVFAVLYTQTAMVVLIVLPFAYFRLQKVVKILVRFWAQSVFWILGKKLRISGTENYSKNKRYIIIANHASMFDITAIMAFYPDVAWFGHERLMKIPVFSQILKMTNYIPLKETNIKNTKLMLDEIVEKSKQHTIAIFPEGTRTLNGSVNNFYRGFVYLLRDSDAEILPVTLNGFYLLKPKNRKYINFGAKLGVVINKPIKTSDLKTKTDKEIIAQMKAIIESGITNETKQQ